MGDLCLCFPNFCGKIIFGYEGVKVFVIVVCGTPLLGYQCFTTCWVVLLVICGY